MDGSVDKNQKTDLLIFDFAIFLYLLFSLILDNKP